MAHALNRLVVTTPGFFACEEDSQRLERIELRAFRTIAPVMSPAHFLEGKASGMSERVQRSQARLSIIA